MLHLPNGVWRKVAKYTKGTHSALWTYLITPAALLSLLGVFIIFTIDLTSSSQPTSAVSIPADCEPCAWVLPQLGGPQACERTQAWVEVSLSDLSMETPLVAVVCDRLESIGMDRVGGIVIGGFAEANGGELLLQTMSGRLRYVRMDDICHVYQLASC